MTISREMTIPVSRSTPLTFPSSLFALADVHPSGCSPPPHGASHSRVHAPYSVTYVRRERRSCLGRFEVVDSVASFASSRTDVEYLCFLFRHLVLKFVEHFGSPHLRSVMGVIGSRLHSSSSDSRHPASVPYAYKKKKTFEYCPCAFPSLPPMI